MIALLLANPFRDVPPSGWEEGLLHSIWLNLIRADRYMLYVNGLSVTVRVTLGALVMGLILGFVLSLMKTSNLGFEVGRSGRRVYILRSIAAAYITIVRGTPMVLQIMIWWFGIFAGTPMPRIWVAIIAFGVNSGAYSAETFRAGILSVDKGQTEAGRSVGLSSFQTMRLIILPQALKNALPPLFNELIALLKETAVVGWIGLQDLTMASSIVRSRTYSAFTPVIASAVVYLTIVLILTGILSQVEKMLRRGDARTDTAGGFGRGRLRTPAEGGSAS